MNIQKNESRNASVPGFFNQIDMQRLDILFFGFVFVFRLNPGFRTTYPGFMKAVSSPFRKYFFRLTFLPMLLKQPPLPFLSLLQTQLRFLR